MDDFQLETVGVVEEHRVIPRHVRVFLRLAFQLRALRAQPVRALVDLRARVGLECEVMEPDRVTIVWPGVGLRCSLPPRNHGAGTPEMFALAPLLGRA